MSDRFVRVIPQKCLPISLSPYLPICSLLRCYLLLCSVLLDSNHLWLYVLIPAIDRFPHPDAGMVIPVMGWVDMHHGDIKHAKKTSWRFSGLSAVRVIFPSNGKVSIEMSQFT
jgi:hypothetical protein